MREDIQTASYQTLNLLGIEIEAKMQHLTTKLVYWQMGRFTVVLRAGTASGERLIRASDWTTLEEAHSTLR